jgi:hypothetical protein
MSENFRERFAAYRPSKGVWFWTTAGAVVATMVVGFTWGGWVTGGTATERAEKAAGEAVAMLAAEICAHNFLQAGDAHVQLSALKEERSSQRRSILENGGWVTLAGAEKPVRGASALCADRLMEAELAPATMPVADAATEAATPS